MFNDIDLKGRSFSFQPEGYDEPQQGSFSSEEGMAEENEIEYKSGVSLCTDENGLDHIEFQNISIGLGVEMVRLENGNLCFRRTNSVGQDTATLEKGSITGDMHGKIISLDYNYDSSNGKVVSLDNMCKDFEAEPGNVLNINICGDKAYVASGLHIQGDFYRFLIDASSYDGEATIKNCNISGTGSPRTVHVRSAELAVEPHLDSAMKYSRDMFEKYDRDAMNSSLAKFVDTFSQPINNLTIPSPVMESHHSHGVEGPSHSHAYYVPFGTYQMNPQLFSSQQIVDYSQASSPPLTTGWFPNVIGAASSSTAIQQNYNGNA